MITNIPKIYYFIYKTTNLINGKTYTGKHKTNNLNDGYLGSGVVFQRSLNKYGKEKFKREIICFCETSDELIIKEKELITDEFLKINKNTIYNISLGGQGGDMISNHPDKNKIIENRKGSKNGFYGKKHSDEAKRKISESHKGTKSYMYGKKNKWMSDFNKTRVREKNPMFGKRYTEEEKKKFASFCGKES
jgi:group I intron endonuclease